MASKSGENCNLESLKCTESVRYPESMTPGSQYIQCVGQPVNEDMACSDQIMFNVTYLRIFIKLIMYNYSPTIRMCTHGSIVITST